MVIFPWEGKSYVKKIHSSTLHLHLAQFALAFPEEVIILFVMGLKDGFSKALGINEIYSFSSENIDPHVKLLAIIWSQHVHGYQVCKFFCHCYSCVVVAYGSVKGSLMIIFYCSAL